MRLFIVFLNVRENLWAFLGCYWNILFFLENTFYFFVLKLFFTIMKLFHNTWNSFKVHFRIILMKLVVIYDGLVLIVVFADAVHSSHELFILIYNCHFPVLDGFWTDLVVHDVIDVAEVVYILSIEILVKEGVIYEDLEWRFLAKRTILW